MTNRTLNDAGGWARIALASALPAMIGCNDSHHAVRDVWPHWAPKTLAVAPALNTSGTTSFDPVRVSDLAASELCTFTGVRVVAVNRVLAAMTNRGLDAIRSPEDALQVAEDVGADGMIVFAVTEYDPYDPPIVGLTMQLYAPSDPFRPDWIDPVEVSRRPTPATGVAARPAGSPWAEFQQVFNASHGDVVADVKTYARSRDADDRPYGWRKYLVSQEHYLRFCLHAAMAELLETPGAQADVESANAEEDRT
jgi:hypothetical protein